MEGVLAVKLFCFILHKFWLIILVDQSENLVNLAQVVFVIPHITLDIVLSRKSKTSYFDTIRSVHVVSARLNKHQL